MVVGRARVAAAIAVGKNTASYLIDFENYAPDSNIGLPVDGRERVQLLTSLLGEVAAFAGVKALNVAITDCEEIESVITLEASSLASRLIADMEEYAPPNILYVLQTARL